MSGFWRRALTALAVAGAALSGLQAQEKAPAILFRDSSPTTLIYERQCRPITALSWADATTETTLRDQVCRPRAIRGEGDTCQTPRPPRLVYGCAWERDKQLFCRLRARAPLVVPVASGPPQVSLDDQAWVEAPDIVIVTLPPGPWTATGSVGGAARIFPVDTSGVPVIIPVRP